LKGQGQRIWAGYPVPCDREAINPPKLPFGRAASIRTWFTRRKPLCADGSGGIEIERNHANAGVARQI